MGIIRRDRPAPTPPLHRLIVGSGKQIRVDDAQQIARFRTRVSQDYWQSRAAVFNDSLPILGYSHDFVRDSMSRVRPVPCIENDDPAQPPIPITKDTAPAGLDPELSDIILQRIAPFPEFVGQVAHKLDIFGEAYAALIEDDVDGDGEERCRVFSPREIFTLGDQWRWKRDPADSVGVPLKPDTAFWRMWLPHPEFSALPYSHMIRLLLPCEELLMLSALIKAISRSRQATTGKIIAIADEFTLEAPALEGHAPTDDAGDGEIQSDPFFEDFFASMTAALQDPESAAGVMPIIIRGPRDLIKDGIVVHDISRTYEETLIKLRQEAREEIATGVNLPREIPLGVGSTNHWNDRSIREDLWLNHLEPRAMALFSAVTTSFFRPALLQNGVPPEIARRCVVGYDPTWFLGAPDRSETADAALGHYAISLGAYREANNWSEDDAPTDEEIQMRIGWKQQEQLRTTIREDAGAAAGEVQIAPTAEAGTAKPKVVAPAKDATVDVPDAQDTSAPDMPKVASARASKLERLGPKLVAIERTLRTRLHAATEAAVVAALESAGLKARNTVNKAAQQASRSVRETHAALLAQIEVVPKADMVAALGRHTVAAYGLSDQQLLSGALRTLEPKYHQLVRAAQQQAAQAAADAAGRDVDEQQVDQATKDARTAGWVILSAGVLALASDLLYNPHPEAPAVGEFDQTTVVPIGLVRAALDRAGGAQVGAVTRDGKPRSAPSRSTGPGGEPGGGGATAGPSMLDEFKQQLGIVEDTYTWVYGDAPRRAFPPHLDLDGVTFSSWDDDALANGEGWPDAPYFSPGDHDGCCCDFAVSFSQAGEEPE